VSSFDDDLVDHVAPLLRYARGLCRNVAMSDDLVQQTLLRALRARDQLDGSPDLAAWLYTVLRREYWRQARVASRYVGGEQGVDRLMSFSVPPSQEIRVQFVEACDAYQGLPKVQRTALDLVVLYGLTYEDAAEVAGCSTNTMKTRVARGRAALKARFTTPSACNTLPTQPHEATGDQTT
jgi:RNA polymerase sigma-70 factor, ECF subfamily